MILSRIQEPSIFNLLFFWLSSCVIFNGDFLIPTSGPLNFYASWYLYGTSNSHWTLAKSTFFSVFLLYIDIYVSYIYETYFFKISRTSAFRKVYMLWGYFLPLKSYVHLKSGYYPISCLWTIPSHENPVHRSRLWVWWNFKLP